MSVKIRYTDEPLGDPKVVPDFLPRPEDLVFRDEGVKDVTIWLTTNLDAEARPDAEMVWGRWVNLEAKS